MLYNGFRFHRTSVALLLTLFPFRPLTLLSTRKSPAKHLTYWHREHLSDTQLPILFIHGIGVGLYPYTDFLRDINESASLDKNVAIVGIIAVEVMAVSSRITYQAFDKDVLVHEIQQILKYHGWSRCVLVGHSYGTVICTHLLKSQKTAQLIGPIVLIDPICFLLHHPDVAYNFTVRRPAHAKELVLSYFGSRDIGVAHTLAQRFFWSQNILWKEDLQCGGGNEIEHKATTVVLSGKDDIVDVHCVKQYLSSSSIAEYDAQNGIIWKANGSRMGSRFNIAQDEKSRMDTIEWIGSGLELIWFERFHHGQVFDFENARKSVIRAIRAYSCRAQE